MPNGERSDHDWSVEKFHLYDRFYGDLNTMMKTPESIEAELPKIEEVNLTWIDAATERLIQKESYWRIKRPE